MDNFEKINSSHRGNGSTAFLVGRHQDGYGPVYPLVPGERLTLGRASTNRVVLKDELCSREHAEIFFRGGKWYVRDLQSLNGTRVDGTSLLGEEELTTRAELRLGRTIFVFVEQMDQLPQVSTPDLGESARGISIKKRLGQTRYLTPLPEENPNEENSEEHTVPSIRHSITRDLALLYRLSLNMGSAANYEELVQIVLTGLLEATPADVGAVLTWNDHQELEVIGFRHRDPSNKTYHKVCEFVSNEVLARREAILAEDGDRNDYLRNKESPEHGGGSSLICAPVIFGEKILGVIHLYCTNPHSTLTGEDLEFTVAVAKHLGATTHQIQRQESLYASNQSLKSQLKVESELVGESSAIVQIESQIARVAGTNATVLIRGESGVGKELVARAIHYSSHRKDGPFICLNCAAITETLLESELFGHEKGSFTGATEKKIGKFEAAHGGTIFLDEIGEMSVATQAKLLRILEGHPFERVGGGTPIRVDVRVVSATNQPLEQAMQEGQFRRDLFYRLQVVEIRVPPLRERKSDVPILADYFLRRFVNETGRRIQGFSAAAMTAMQDYSWPGNVRELRNVVERAVALGRGPYLDLQDIWPPSHELHSPGIEDSYSHYQPRSLTELEKVHIERTLQHTDWNKSQAASILKIERSTLDRKIKAYEIKR